VIRAIAHGVEGGKVYIVCIRVGAGIGRRSKRERACVGYIDRVYLLDQPPFSVVQSDVADSDDVQQRGFAIIQPGYRAWLVAVTDSPAGRVENV